MPPRSPIRFLCRTLSLALGTVFAFAAPPSVAADTESAPVQPAESIKLTSVQPVVIDVKSRELVAREKAHLEYGPWAITADEIRVNNTTKRATAAGHVVLYQPGFRLLAESVHYDMKTGDVEAWDYRFGRPPLHATGARAHGNADLMVLEDVNLVYGDPGPLAPRGSAKALRVYSDGKFTADSIRVEADGLRLAVGPVPVVAFTGIGRKLDAPNVQLEVAGGLNSTLGLHVGLGAYVPTAPGVWLGGSVDGFSKRGFLVGPGARYDTTHGDVHYSGTTNLAYIRDSGDRGTDILGEDIGAGRGFWHWEHQQQGADGRWTVNGELNAWSDSAVYRDFRDSLFDRNQEPDSFLEGSLNGANYIFSALTRVRVNDFLSIAERLPEVRFDLLPTPTGLGGTVVELNASAAMLREESLDGGPDLRADRVDVYTRVSRTLKVAKGATFTPVVGGRMTHYGNMGEGTSHYTRWLGEIGFDASLRASKIKELEKPVWGFNGLRHVIEPRIEYRYIPGPSDDAPALPEIDRPAFLTQLQPLGLADRRDIDTLGEVHAVRLSLDNILETRRPDYGSRQLLHFNVAADLQLDADPGEDDLSDIHGELLLTPAPWLEWWFYSRLGTGDESGVREFNTRLMIVDGDSWSAGVGGHFLRNDIEQIHLFGRYRFNEAREVYGAVRYDAREKRFNEIQVGVTARLAQNWQSGLAVRFRDGSQRESDFGLRVELRFLEF